MCKTCENEGKTRKHQLSESGEIKARNFGKKQQMKTIIPKDKKNGKKNREGSSEIKLYNFLQ